MLALVNLDKSSNSGREGLSDLSAANDIGYTRKSASLIPPLAPPSISESVAEDKCWRRLSRTLKVLRVYVQPKTTVMVVNQLVSVLLYRIHV
jgi:hypothetical protein